MKRAPILLVTAPLLAALCLCATPAEATVWPSSHQRIAKALESGDISKRRKAAAKLASLPPRLAKELARNALRDADVEVRLYAARAAAELGVDKAGDEVVSWLSERNARLRVAACELIEAAPTPTAVRALARVLSDSQASVRRAAAAAMGGSGMDEAVSPLLGHLDDGSQSVRLEVVRALGRIGDRRAVVPLVSKLQDQEAEVRREAARSLGQLRDGRATATLMLALQDQDVSVQVQALQALGRLGAGEATTAIAALFASDAGRAIGTAAARGPVHDAALRALGHIGTPEAVRLLVDALEREGPVPLGTTGSARGPGAAPVRAALVVAGKAAVDALIGRLRASPSQRLASAAVLALGALQTKRAVPVIIKSAQRGSVALDAALEALRSIGDSAALPFVLEHLDDGDARIRQVVVRVASELLEPEARDGRAVDVARARVVDLTVPLAERLALVKLLGRTGSPRAQAILLSLANAKQTALRVAVIKALGALGVSSPAVDAALLDALSASEQRLRMAAAVAIGRVGRDAAAHKLLHRLGVSAEQDRGALGIALSGALGRSSDGKLVAAVGKAMASAPAVARDALIEGLGRMKGVAAGKLLGELRRGADVDDRRKIAEALAGHPESQAVLLSLAADPDPSVRANASWSLGRAGDASSVATLLRLLGDRDVAVAGNAAIALAKVVTRGKAKPTPQLEKSLCDALSDYRSYVRAAALTGMRMARLACGQESARRLLHRDRSWRVRLAAAQLLRTRVAPTAKGAGKNAGPASPNARALWRCSIEDRDAAVAERCGSGEPDPVTSHDVLAYVVADGKTSPSARAPFALVLADGSMRLGVADRRGAVFEREAPGGALELAVPAALAP